MMAPTCIVWISSCCLKSIAIRSAHTSTQVFLHFPLLNSMHVSGSITTTGRRANARTVASRAIVAPNGRVAIQAIAPRTATPSVP